MKTPPCEHDQVPTGYSRVDAYSDGRTVVVLGTPPDGDTHNCDEMGCGSLDHVIYRLPLVPSRRIAELKAALAAEKANAARALQDYQAEQRSAAAFWDEERVRRNAQMDQALRCIAELTAALAAEKAKHAALITWTRRFLPPARRGASNRRVTEGKP